MIVNTETGQLSHNQKQIFISSEVKNKVLSIHPLHAFSHFIYFILFLPFWCFKVTKVLTRTFIAERGFCKEKKNTPYYHNMSIFFTQDKAILKCSYFLKA